MSLKFAFILIAIIAVLCFVIGRITAPKDHVLSSSSVTNYSDTLSTSSEPLSSSKTKVIVRADSVKLDSLKRVIVNKDSLILYLSDGWEQNFETPIQSDSVKGTIRTDVYSDPIAKMTYGSSWLENLVIPHSKEIDSVRVDVPVPYVTFKDGSEIAGVSVLVTSLAVAVGVPPAVAGVFGILIYFISEVF